MGSDLERKEGKGERKERKGRARREWLRGWEVTKIIKERKGREWRGKKKGWEGKGRMGGREGKGRQGKARQGKATRKERSSAFTSVFVEWKRSVTAKREESFHCIC